MASRILRSRSATVQRASTRAGPYDRRRHVADFETALSEDDDPGKMAPRWGGGGRALTRRGGDDDDDDEDADADDETYEQDESEHGDADEELGEEVEIEEEELEVEDPVPGPSMTRCGGVPATRRGGSNDPTDQPPQKRIRLGSEEDVDDDQRIWTYPIHTWDDIADHNRFAAGVVSRLQNHSTDNLPPILSLIYIPWARPEYPKSQLDSQFNGKAKESSSRYKHDDIPWLPTSIPTDTPGWTFLVYHMLGASFDEITSRLSNSQYGKDNLDKGSRWVRKKADDFRKSRGGVLWLSGNALAKKEGSKKSAPGAAGTAKKLKKNGKLRDPNSDVPMSTNEILKPLTPLQIRANCLWEVDGQTGTFADLKAKKSQSKKGKAPVQQTQRFRLTWQTDIPPKVLAALDKIGTTEITDDDLQQEYPNLFRYGVYPDGTPINTKFFGKKFYADAMASAHGTTANFGVPVFSRAAVQEMQMKQVAMLQRHGFLLGNDGALHHSPYYSNCGCRVDQLPTPDPEDSDSRVRHPRFGPLNPSAASKIPRDANAYDPYNTQADPAKRIVGRGSEHPDTLRLEEAARATLRNMDEMEEAAGLAPEDQERHMEQA